MSNNSITYILYLLAMKTDKTTHIFNKPNKFQKRLSGKVINKKL